MWRVWSFPEGGAPKWTTPPVTASEVGLEAAIAWLSERQHRALASAQLVVIGLGARGARNRVASGALHRVHTSVYAIGGASLSGDGRAMAAVLACGPGAALSHRAAAHLRGLRRSSRRRIDVTTPRQRGRRDPLIDVHRSRTLLPRDLTYVDNIPCTGVARTLLDLAEVVPERELERAIDEAQVQRLFDLRELESVLSRADGRRGAAVLSRLIPREGGTTLTRRELEELFLALCDARGLARPEVNKRVALPLGESFEVDFLWRERTLVVETDSWTFHRTRRAFEADRGRDQRLMAAGYRVLRVTWRQVVDEPQRIADTLAGLLRAAA